ncbi:hypothetical protein CYLTODRAFT_348447 [Cylindrobasidium torrendii FP15055 ss-10]|uniref:Nucleolus and neural progenitor protein-like N-terminal domain-containing protein n=1 Tax=Cylindrobasidium torrendii FP15055 ss-10 TaxID=1314674 RepID=A0A0D7BHB5_9AGAR|nr:hypothetical protein CYLTODRAFT_348447 [Cylindrobasidium torrendii FP15055 ss-10]
MNAPRHAKFCPLGQEPRASLNKAVHPEVDAALKSVKKCRRNLAAMLEIIQDERAILERLYYKGKNQHGAALFWKRVTETRRFSQRLDAVAFLDLLDTFMLSFFSANAIPDKMKGSWLFYPSTQYCTSVQRRLEAGLALIEQVHFLMLPSLLITGKARQKCAS